MTLSEDSNRLTEEGLRYDGHVTEQTRLLPRTSVDLKEDDVGGDTKKRQRKPSRLRLCAVMASCIVVQLLAVGTGYSLSVMYVEVIDVFSAPRSEAALIQSVYIGLMTGGGVFWSWLIARVGPGPCIMAGSVVACIGMVGSALAVNVATVIVCTGVIAGIGMSFGYLGTFIAVSWIFHEDAGVPLVFLTVGSAIGQFIIPYLMELLIANYGMRGAFLITGALLFNAAVAGMVIYTSREYFKTGSDDSAANKRKTCDSSLFKDLILLNILLCSLLLAFTGPAESWFFVDIMAIRGYNRETGSLFVTMIGLANFVGRFIGAMLRIFSRRPTVYHWIYLCLVLAVSHFLVTMVFDYWASFGNLMLYGAAFGVTVAQTPAIIYEASGLERYPQATAMLNVMYGLGNGFGGLTGGLIKDATGSYDLVFFIATGSSIFISIATVVMLVILKVTGSTRFSTKKSDETVKYVALDESAAFSQSYARNGHAIRK